VPRDLTGRSYPFPKSDLFPNGGVSVGFHGGFASPGRSDADSAGTADLNRYPTFPRSRIFAQKLRSIPDGDGTLLDHSLTL